MATNVEGSWSGSEASLAFDIEPAFWQAAWFRAGCLLACAAIFFLFYRLRLRSLARQLNLRFEERLAERTRIARDLHDTLLQGFLSASMQLHVAAERVPDNSPAKPLLDRVIQLVQQVTEEGRNAVRGLRSSNPGAGELETAFCGIRQELGVGEDVKFRVIVEGRPRALHPILRDEVYRIGREALRNAFRHADARDVEIELDYARQHFRFNVRDNGRGIDPAILASGRDGHYGLRGMRERAEKIGGRLRVWSAASAGTEVELLLPSRIAYAATSSDGIAAQSPWESSWRG